jgi:CRP-like cAMP-binding protein
MTPHEQLLSYFQSKTPLSLGEFSEFKDLFTLKKVKRNEFLLREGEVCSFNLFVVSGLLDLLQKTGQYF